MPSNLLTADTMFPNLEGKRTDEKFDILTNYLYMLLEQLRYTLGNLGIDNFNSDEFLKIGKTITNPIYAQLEDDEGNLTLLQVTAQGLASRVSDAEGNISTLAQTATSLTSQISDANGNISALQQTAQGLASRISDAEGNISTLTQTAQGLSSRVTDAEGNISTLQQTSSGLLSRMTSAEGNISTLTQTANSLTSQISGKIDEDAAQSLINQSLKEITLGVTSSDGTTVFTLKSGSTTLSTKTLDLTVDAVNVSGVLNANNLTMTGLFEVYRGSSIYGYIGASTASTALGTGVTMCDSTASNGFLAMTTGARMQYGSTDSQVAVYGDVCVTANGTYYYFLTGSFNTTDGSTLGTASRLWGQIYSTNNTISTSDRNLKHDIEDLDERYLQFILWLIPKRFKMNNGTSNRYHIGFIAQDVYEGMELFGISDLEFAGWVKDVDADGNEILMLRYEEFIGLVQLGLLNHEKRISVLEGKV